MSTFTEVCCIVLHFQSIGTIELKHSDTKDDHSETQNGELIEEMGINVINETPRRRNLFPFLLNHSLILKFSVVKCANGSFLNIIALINISIIGSYGSNFALPLWYGMLVSHLNSYFVLLSCFW